jgi:general secretion pathway protein H
MITHVAASRACGFTLIELLVVLMIMGLCVGLVSAIVHPDDRGQLRVESERLAQLLELVSVESRLSGKSIAWTSSGTSYRFWRMTGNAGEAANWAEIYDSDLLRVRTLPNGMTISGVEIENRSAQGASRLEFAPYGLVLSFAIELSLGADHYKVIGSPIGELRVLPGDGPLSGANVTSFSQR